MSVLILGYGNTLRSDDGLGVVAANLLAERLPEGNIKIITSQQLGPEMVEDLRESHLAIFIDAGITNAPGESSCTPLFPQTEVPTGVSHHFTPGTLLALCQTFYGKAPEAYLYSVGAASFDLGEALTPTVQAAIPGLIDAVIERIQKS